MSASTVISFTEHPTGECSISDFLFVSAPGSDSGVHQTPGSAAGHESPDRYRPEAGTAVPHLNTNLASFLLKWMCSKVV